MLAIQWDRLDVTVVPFMVDKYKPLLISHGIAFSKKPLTGFHFLTNISP